MLASKSQHNHLTGEAFLAWYLYIVRTSTTACRAIVPFHSNTTWQASWCCPSVSAHPANGIRCSSNSAIADHFPSKTFSFKHHLTGEAWPACRARLPFHSRGSFFFLPVFGRCCPSVSAHLAKVLLCTKNVCTKVPLALWSVLASNIYVYIYNCNKFLFYV